MPQTTPFFRRLEPANQTKIWKNWSGYLVAPNYQYSIATEYYAIRNAVAVLDTSPLFKYAISGADARKFLARTMARGISGCGSGKAQYTVWCNEAGFVLQDGVVICLDDGNFLLTSAEPSLRYFRKIARNHGMKLDIQDISKRYGILAIQGPHAHDLLSKLTDATVQLKYFGATKTEFGEYPIVISRTGYTGDLGYEIWVRSEHAVAVWDLIVAAGKDFNLVPMGTTALKMSRVEAGLLLMGVDFHNAKHAWVDAQRESPLELGWGWMFRNLDADPREFIGRRAIETAVKNQTSRWKTVGIEIDWKDYQRIHVEAGISPPMHEIYSEQTMSLYRISDKPYDYVGYASSFLFSSLLKKPIAIAKLPLEMVSPGTELEIEMTVIRQPVYVKARVAKLPFYNPGRKTASVS